MPFSVLSLSVLSGTKSNMQNGLSLSYFIVEFYHYFPFVNHNVLGRVRTQTLFILQLWTCLRIRFLSLVREQLEQL